MNKNDLGRSLLACDETPGGTLASLARLAERDRWRMRLLGGVTLFLWVAAAASVFLLVFVYVVYVEPKLAKLSSDSHLPVETRNLVDVGSLTAQYVVGVTTASLLAALSTVWLVFASRRATLRQVSEQLTVISHQLMELRRDERGRDPGPATSTS